MRQVAATTASMLDRRGRWHRVIWNCAAARGVLLHRYYLLNTRWLGIYLHRLMTSDDDRSLHDHPWSFVTVLIGGGYFEIAHVLNADGVIVGEQKSWWPRWSVLYRPAEWSHRLELTKPTWTLVFRWKTRREWGFYLPSGWMDYRSYGRRFCD